MFYEERVIDGVLCWRNNPDDDFTQYTAAQLTRNLQVEKKKVQAVDEISCRRYEEILELRAQLAETEDALNSLLRSDAKIRYKQDKTIAKVLRYAEEETKLHKVGVDASGEISTIVCNCSLCNAVREAKEV